MSRVSSRNSPTAIATACHPPSTFATTHPTTIAPIQAPTTSAHMTTSALPPFSTSRLSTMASPHPTSLAQFPDTTPAPSGAFHDSQPTTTLYVRGFDANFDETSLKYMFMAFNDRLLNYGLVGQAGGSGASTTRTAYVQTKTMDTAREIQATFHNKNGLTVELGHPSSQSSRPSSDGPSPTTSHAAISSPASRFDAFSPVETTSTHSGASLRNGNGHPFNGYQNHYMPQQTPIGNHLQSQPRIPGRVSGKALINDANDDDDVLRLAQEYPAENTPSFTDRGHNGHYTATNGSLPYAENGTAQMPRRATAPHLHIDERLRALNLSSNGMSGPQRGANGGMYPQPTHANGMSPTNVPGSRAYPHHSNYPAGGPQRFPPPSCPADQNEPCNTLYVGNLPLDATEEQLRKLFTGVHGYKRMCYRTKPNGPMCFVEFEDTSTAAQAMDKMYGVPVNESQALKKGGMRLSFSKNPLGVRGVQTGGPGSAGSMRGHQGPMGHGANGYAAAAGPPPGLHYPAPPPGLGPNGSASSYTIPPGLANGGMMNGSGQASINGSNMSNGSSYALQGTNGHVVNGRGNSVLGVGNGNGAAFDQRSALSSPWSSHYGSSTTPGPNPYAQAFALPPYISPTNGGYNTGSTNGFGSYGRGGARQASS